MRDNELAISIGAMIGGMTYDEAYNHAGAELAEAAKMGEKCVKNSRFLWTDATELQQALASGEIVAAYAWNDIVKNLTKEGIPVAYAKPKEGYFTWFCGMTMLNSGKADRRSPMISSTLGSRPKPASTSSRDRATATPTSNPSRSPTRKMLPPWASPIRSST